MQVSDRYPFDAAQGCCVVTGRYHVDPGEHIIDLDLDLNIIPLGGRVCLSQLAVRDMVTLLGWKLATPEMLTEHEATLEALSDACEQLDELMEAMTGMVNLPAVERALDIAARKIAGKDSIQEWVDTLPRAAKR